MDHPEDHQVQQVIRVLQELVQQDHLVQQVLEAHLDHLVPQVAHLVKREHKVLEYKDRKVPLDPMVPQDQKVKKVHQEDHQVQQDHKVMPEMLVLKVLLD